MSFLGFLLMMIASFSAATAQPSHSPISVREVTTDMEDVKTQLSSNVLTQKEKFIVISKADSAVRENLFNELMSELQENPGKELEVWQVELLHSNGESVTVKRIGPDGQELTLDEVKRLLERLVSGERNLTIDKLLQQEGIIIKRYWVRKEK